MDDIVKQALVKWPNVPHCYGWLGLDARGNWYLRDDRAQAAGDFGGGTPHSKGSLLRHEKLIDFIHRNYESDDEGQWFFQNGPQRVYVELECTPWIWRLDGDFNVSAHTGKPASAQQCLLDAQGRVYLQTDLGLGLVHTQDVGHAAEAVELGLWVPEDVLVEALPERYHFKRSPATLHGVSR
jgi:Protein of unknown function (DUF2946)